MTAAILTLLVALVALAFSAFSSGAETGLYCANRLRIELGAQQQDRRCIRLSRLLRDEQDVLTVTLLGATVGDYVLSSAVAFAFVELLRVGDFDAEVYTVVVCTPIVFVFGTVVPKNVFQLHADSLMPRVASLLSGAERVLRLTGTLALLRALAFWAGRLAGMSAAAAALPTPRWRVANLLREALADQEHGADRSQLITRVVRLSEMPLHLVMTPKSDVASLGSDADREALMTVARRTEHILVPVSDRAGKVVGVVKVDELLKAQDWKTVSDRIRPVTRLTPHSTVAAAIASLQAQGRNMAVVADQTGRMLGLVTLSDLVTKVVGEPTKP